MIARVIAGRLKQLGLDRRLGEPFSRHLAYLDRKEAALGRPRISVQRTPYFCSGCPHNTSTKVPDGSRAMAGIGCHYMVLPMGRNTSTFTHMGGEGVPWTGQAPFTTTEHVFANLGDGTYFHSGLLAIRAAVAARVSMTYKILYNDAVAMTGGQHVDGPLDPAMISRQIAAEGVSPIVVVTDEPEKYSSATPWAAGVTIRHRDELDAVQRELREVKGVSAIIYDQTCAAEKRRRRKRNEYPDPAKRVIINELVCEGCGDCNSASNCLSVEPHDTEFGRKRRINQSTCNKDYSCVKGFCPSFVTVEGGALRKARASATAAAHELPAPPDPVITPIAGTFNALITGIGGTGVLTIGQILAAAAHAEGKGVSVLDMSGLAQKGGPVMSHVRMAHSPDDLHAVRVGTGAADLVIGCDLVVTASADSLARMNDLRTRVAVNATEAPTSDFIRNRDWQMPGSDLRHDITSAANATQVDFIDASELATALLGDAIAANMFLLGYTFQKGWIPLSAAALERAIDLNGVAVQANRTAFLWGRHAAHDLRRVEKIAFPAEVVRLHPPLSATLDELIDRRAGFLTGYQNTTLARRYRQLVDKVRRAEVQLGVDDKLPLAHAVARAWFKLLAVKDEYEVARLHTRPEFLKEIRDQFEGDIKLKFHLAPPVLNKPDPTTGVAKKSEFGPWMLSVFRLLAPLRFLRGTALDPFGYNEERRMEHQLIVDYEKTIDELLAGLAPGNVELAVLIAAIPEDIRGYGHVKAKSVQQARQVQDKLLAQFRAPTATQARAA